MMGWHGSAREAKKILFTPYILFGALALVVLLPMLRPGYIFALDMAFTPELRMPGEIRSSYLFHAALHVLNFVIPSQVLQKAMLFAILFVSGLGMYRLALRFWAGQSSGTPRAAVPAVHTLDAYTQWGACLSGALYMINPFTYSRFMAGQYAVLLGYACLPFFVWALIRFLDRPQLRTTIILALWVTLISIFSVHTLGLVAILAIVGVGLSGWRYRHRSSHLLRIVKYGLLGIGFALAASIYWLVPTLTGDNSAGRAIAHFSKGDQAAFVTQGGGWAGQLANVLHLQGFWAETRHLYALPQQRMPLWGFAGLAVLALACYGAVAAWQKGQRYAVCLVGISAVLAIIIALGALTTIDNLTVLNGFREPHKFVGLLALAYALFAGRGAAQALRRIDAAGHSTALNIAAILLVLLPVAWTPTMFWGFGGQLKPRHYPADWAQVNLLLNRDSGTFNVLFLPWHLYTYFDFAGRIVVNPAEQYFDKPVIASNQLEFGRATPTMPDARKQYLTTTVLRQAPNRTDLGHRLAEQGIKYVILDRAYDVRNYTYLDQQDDLHLDAVSAHLKVYRNKAFTGEN